MSRAIVTVGVSKTRDFKPYLERFRRTMAEHGQANEVFVWDEHWPPGSPSHEWCHYAFKVHAVNFARAQGHDDVLWLDCSAYAIKSIEPLWERIKAEGHVLITDNEALGKWTSDHCLAHFGMTRDEAMKVPLLCGTCWAVDLTVPRSREFVRRLTHLATPEFFNGTHVSSFARLVEKQLAKHPRPGTEGTQVSMDERCWGHRSDEAVAALVALEMDMAMYAGIEFTGGNAPTEKTCIKSGYDL